MKKILIAPLFTMLVVSCGTTLPSFEGSVSSLLTSHDESSLISQVTSSSSIVSSSSSTSSSTTSSIQSTSSSTSSTSTSSSTSITTSEPPLNTRKVPFNQIGSLVAQVVDAKAMGVVNSKDRPQVRGRKNAQEEDQNYMVKVTETYNPNTQITEDETVQVTFSRVTNTQTTELQTGTESYLATAKPLIIQRLTDLPGNIVINNVEGYEFRLMSGEVVIQDWLSSEQETIEFIFDEELTDITIESRSLNASISFIAFDGFTYTIKQGETIIYEDLEDNDQADNNEALGNITLLGLTEGLTYDVTYEGYQVIETITQDEVEGQVDKLYVLYQYTFISFVPLTINQRPQDKDLELDYDDVPLYDKQGYFSGSTRQSFVVDNNTGLIYKIENINIASLSGGCVSVLNSPFPFDMRITENKELQFYSLHQNSSIKTYFCYKDKHGQKFVRNNKVNLIDSQTNSTFFVYGFHSDFNFVQKFTYLMTENGEVIKIQVNHFGSTDTYNDYFKSAKVISNDFEERSINFPKKTKIYDFETEHNGLRVMFALGSKVFAANYFSHFKGYGQLLLYAYDSILDKHFRLDTRYENTDNTYSTKYLNFGIIIGYYSRTISTYYNVWESFDEKINKNIELNSSNFYFDLYIYSPSLKYNPLNYFEEFTAIEILNEVDIIDQRELNVIKNTLQGSIEFELIPVKDLSNQIKIEAFQVGTYVAPTTISVTLQPTNRN